MNIPVLLFFVVLVAALTAVIIKVNSRNDNDALKIVSNVIVGICLVFSIMFLPFGNDAPTNLYGRALDALNPTKTVKSVAAENPVKPVTMPETEQDDLDEEEEDEEEEELPDFIIYECDDYYIGMDKEEHIMEIFPSEERLEDAKATEKLAYYCYSTELTLAGHPLKVYAARLSGDDGFVCVVLFDEYYTGKTNPGFTECDALFRLYDEDNGYMYGFAYVSSSVESARNYSFYIGSNTTYFKGMYEALKLDKKYFD